MNDDFPTPTLTIEDVTLAEGTAGTSAFTFTVTLSPVAAGPVTVDVATSDGIATTADGDYVANSTTLTFVAGDSSETFTVLVNGDTKNEAYQNFNVNLTNATGGTAISGAGAGTITNDDAVPTILIGDISQFELNAGTSLFQFPVTLSNATDATVTINYATSDVSADDPADYAPAANTLTFIAGEIAKTIDVIVNGEATPEPNERSPSRFPRRSEQHLKTAALSEPSSTTTASRTLIIGDATAAEGVDPTITFTVTRTGHSLRFPQLPQPLLQVLVGSW